ncbi:MAG TPA: metallopeptidase TldD-related protein [Bryobacteraceae bacterium]|nr:metallopeptidase TldD-related protein [Bryobacteraceae bacterium]
MTSWPLEEIAQRVVRDALAAGADAAECTAAEGSQFSVNVRKGEIETLTEAGSCGIGLRVLRGQYVGSAYTSDLTDDGLRTMVSSASELSRITTADPFAGLPAAEDLGKLDGDLGLYDGSVAELPAQWKIDQARAAEAAALEADPRISNSEGASFDSTISRRVFANSLGFTGSYRSSFCALSAVPVATDNGAMQRDYWRSLARNASGLESPEAVGKKAAERTLRRLGARKVPTQKVPVLFEPRVARSLLDHIFDAVNGSSIYRGESFLAGSMGQRIAPEHFTLVDDATIPGRFGTSPFDDEGVTSRRTTVIEAGVLRSWLLNSYSARKLNLRTTGNASRGITGNAGVGHGNLYLEPGTASPDDLIGGIQSGLYVTELIGFGVNTVTGDYSRGAVGLWIENGRLTYPVHEITIAGTLQEMLLGIEAIGSDLEFRGSIASPTLLIREMTVSGT